ncbi:MAG: glutathione peroxidase [Flavobacteriaceae bacterium]|nr:glutathione peroxidase [Flavobacteriaceae bacterium]
MKYICLLSLLVVLNACSQTTKSKTTKGLKTEKIAMKTEDIYQFKMTDLYGKDFDFSSLKGKKVMLVNTASKCGYTPQYKDLEKLYKTYKDKNFVIIGFPANNFGKQEPGTDGEIAAFCEQNYDVSFPMMTKTSVKGADMNPVYKFLTQKSKNGFGDSGVAWNFQKYLIDENGHVVNMYKSKVLPTDPAIVKWIENN